MIGARTEKGVLVILCHGGQNPRETQLNRGKVYLNLWFQRVSVHHDGSVRLGTRMVWQTRKRRHSRRQAGRTLKGSCFATHFLQDKFHCQGGEARVVLGGEMTF